MDTKLLSKYRTQILGIAIVWCLAFHSGYQFSSSILNAILFYGWVSVDIFLFLSGVGIYFSLQKESSSKLFYMKRFLRIYPSFIIAVIVYSVYKNFSLPETILNILTVNYWINSPYQFNWFMSGLIVLYAISPWYYKLFKRSPGIVTVIGVVLVLLIVAVTPLHVFYVTTRIPIFLIGFYFGYLILEKKLSEAENRRNIWIMFFAFVIGLVCFYYVRTNLWGLVPQLRTLCIIFIAPFLSLAIAQVLSIFKNYKYPFLSFLGKYSLILYLFYDMIADYLIRIDKVLYKIVDISIYPQWVSEITVFVIGCSFAYLFQNMMDKVTDKMKPK